MPYDILQLNDMLVPELLDVAENLKIDNAKSFDKQTLVYKILDKQAMDGKPVDDAKKKRGRKPKEEAAEPVAVKAPAAPVAAAESADEAGGEKKKRGRKPKEQSEDTPAPAAAPTPAQEESKPAIEAVANSA